MKGVKMLIKKLECNDYLFYRPTIRRLLIASYLQDYSLTERQIALLIDEKLQGLDSYIKTNAFIIGAIKGEDLLGFTWIYQYDENGQERFHFNEIVVDSNCREMGIGRKLTEKSVEVVKEAGVKIIDLIVAEDNLASRKLIEKQGFKTHKRYLVKRLKGR